MSARVEREPAWVIHRRPWRESSLLLDLFSLNRGRVSAVAKGAQRRNQPWQSQLQPFVPLQLAWLGRGSLKTLTGADPGPAVPALTGNRLYCGLYLNELIQRLLPEEEPFPVVFTGYMEALQALSQAPDSTALELPLRRFEWSLVSQLGYGLSLDRVSETGEPVRSDHSYCLDPEQGIRQTPGPGCRLQQLPGEHLLAMAVGDLSSVPVRRCAKRVMRVLIDHLLQGRPLHSRQLFR
ncbi:MAG: DNA repair protein RecO [Oleiphilaceae bacterium]|nr:DNA repair protein RecO [Oleiphilaceae bacterium]